MRHRFMAGIVPALLLAGFCFWGGAIARAAPDLDVGAMRSSVVQVFVTSQPADYYTPWQRPRPDESSGSSFYIGNRLLMTNAHVVSDARNIEIKRADRADRVTARVVFVGHDCDLAVITTDDAAFFDGMVPLEIGEQPAIRTTVATVGYPMGGEKLSITEGIISRIEIHAYAHTRGDAHLTIQTDAAINPGNSGGPVLQGGKVVGVAFQGQFFAQNIGYMIPPSVILHFLTDVADGHYHGYPEFGVYTAKLENDHLRRYLGVPADATGVLVLKPLPYASAMGHIQRNDVLHSIDGFPILNDGTVLIDGELLDFTFVVEGKQIGESVNVQLRREGKLMEVAIPLVAWGARMKPSYAYDQEPEYWVYGGYVFAPVTTNYLSRAGQSEELTYYYRQYYRMVAEEGQTREQLVVLSRVLPHASTRYRSYDDDIVASVNGSVPLDFGEFVRLVETAPEGRAVVEFEGVNVAPLVLERQKLLAVHQEICESLGITEDRHVDVPALEPAVPEPGPPKSPAAAAPGPNEEPEAGEKPASETKQPKSGEPAPVRNQSARPPVGAESGAVPPRSER